MATLRTKRVSDLIMQEVASIIQRGLKDPRVGFITITSADISPDLRHAKIFYTVYGDEKVREETRQGLISAKKYIRRELGRVLTMKSTPELNFYFDASIERAQRLDDLIEKTHVNDGDDK